MSEDGGELPGTGRERSWDRGGKDGPWDAIVIGSGMGGMVCAALLSKIGRRVLVLEQHYVPGGYTHEFSRRGYHWDVGVHAIGEVSTRSMPGRLLHALTDGRLQWTTLGPVYDAFRLPEGFRIDYPDNPEQFRENLLEAFPGERRGIDGYLDIVKKVSGGMRGYYLSRVLPSTVGLVAEPLLARSVQYYLGVTAKEITARLTGEPKLRAMMTAQWGYYGAKPSRAAFAMQALVVKHFLWGAWYPVGGAGQIAKELLRTVSDCGGWTRIRADVEQILVEGGRAAGVRLKGGEELRAKLVVSAAGALPTLERMLPLEARQAGWARELAQLQPGPAHVCLYLGFKGDIRKAGAGSNNFWFYDTWDVEQDAWQVGGDGPLGNVPALYVSFPSLKNPRHDPGPEQRHTGEAVTFVPWDAFTRFLGTKWMRRGDDYEALKKRMQESLLEQLFRHLPGLKPMLDYAELSTPMSTDHFMRSAKGSIYGLESSPERFRCRWLRPRTPIPGLFLAGVDVSAPGVMGAAMGGALAAIAAEPVAALNFLRRGVL